MAKRLGVADLSALQGDIGTIDSELQAKLDSVLAEARKKEAASLLHLDWHGHRIPVRSESTRLAVLRAQDKTKQIGSSSSSSPSSSSNHEVKSKLYLEAFSLWEDAMRSVRLYILFSTTTTQNTHTYTYRYEKIKLNPKKTQY